MSLVDDINRRIVEAMKARDQATLAPLRMLKTALLNRRVEQGHDLYDGEARQVVATLVKQRHDSVDQFLRGGRQDLAEKEAAEIRILEAYLPPAASADEVAAIVEAAIAETGASSPKDLGRVMKVAMAKLAGHSVDGKAVNALVQRKLNSPR